MSDAIIGQTSWMYVLWYLASLANIQKEIQDDASNTIVIPLTSTHTHNILRIIYRTENTNPTTPDTIDNGQ